MGSIDKITVYCTFEDRGGGRLDIDLNRIESIGELSNISSYVEITMYSGFTHLVRGSVQSVHEKINFGVEEARRKKK